MVVDILCVLLFSLFYLCFLESWHGCRKFELEFLLTLWLSSLGEAPFGAIASTFTYREHSKHVTVELGCRRTQSDKNYTYIFFFDLLRVGSNQTSSKLIFTENFR